MGLGSRSSDPLIQLMEEIEHHLGCVNPCKPVGHNYRFLNWLGGISEPSTALAEMMPVYTWNLTFCPIFWGENHPLKDSKAPNFSSIQKTAQPGVIYQSSRFGPQENHGKV